MCNEEPYVELLEKYSLSENDSIRLKTEFEITKLKVEFAIIQSMKENIPLFESISKFTALQRYTQKLDPTIKYELIKQLKLMKKNHLDEVVKLLFENSDYTKDICTHQRNTECFSYDIYENEGALIHFTNAIVPANPFSEDEILKRKQELKAVALEIGNNPDLRYIFSVSWMWNLKKFKLLMPEVFNKSLREFKDCEFYSLGHWGQFYRFDGSPNNKRMNEFRKNWKFPLKLLLGDCSISDFLQFYSW